MADDNTGQQPGNEQNENMKRVQDFAEKLKSLGLDMNLMFDIFGGIAENAVKKSEQSLAGLIDTKVSVLAKSLSQQIDERQKGIESQLNQVVGILQQGVGGQGQPGTSMIPAGGDIPVGPGLMQSGGGLGGAMGNIAGIVPILKMLGLVPGGGDQGGSGGLAQMATLAKSWGDVMRAMMEPVVEMQTTMRQSLLQEMQTYSRTGGQLPWEADADAPQPRRQVAQLNQRHQLRRPEPVDDTPSDYSKEAAELAKKFKFG